MKTKTVLISVNFLVELPSEVLEQESCVLDNLELALSKVPNGLDDALQVKWESSQSFILDENSINCGKCQKCGRWVTDKDAPNPIRQLCIGALFKGELLCDECLPQDHRWAF
jgi:hypothetical protein